MRADVIIVGAGLVGAGLAWELSRRGARVRVLDAALPAGAASGCSFGWINASFHLSPAHYRLRLAAIGAHRRWEAQLGGTGHRWTGCVFWEGSAEATQAMAEGLDALGYPFEVLDRGGVAARLPQLGAPPPLALHFPDEGAVDAARLTNRLLDAARDAGAEVWVGCPVRALWLEKGRIRGVETAQGRAEGVQVVLAAGVGAPALLAGIGLCLPMLSRPGGILRTRPVAARLGPILAAPGQEVRQEADGSLLAPAAARHQSDAAEKISAPPQVLLDDTLARLRALLPGVAIGAASLALAERPVPGDGLPALGPVPGVAGLWLAVMHSGVTLAPRVAEGLAGALLGGAMAEDMVPFDPARLFG